MNSKKQKTYFDVPDHYNLTKRFLKIIARSDSVAVAEYCMEKVIQYLHHVGELRAANWLEKSWTGERGRFSQGHAGYGCPPHNQGEESGWGRMRYNFPPEAPYHVFISQYIAWNQHKCRDDECRQYMLTDSVFLASEPFLNSELWRAVRKLTVADLRTWDAVNEEPTQWQAMLDTMESYLEGNGHCSLARGFVTWNSTHDEPLLSKRDIGTVVLPTQEFINLLGKGYNFKEGREVCTQKERYIEFMLQDRTRMVRIAHNMAFEPMLNATQYFYSCSPLAEPWALHAQWYCTCKPCFKNCICVHTFMLSLISERRIVISDELDERAIPKKQSTKSAAKEFAGVCKEKEDDRKKRLIFEVCVSIRVHLCLPNACFFCRRRRSSPLEMQMDLGAAQKHRINPVGENTSRRASPGQESPVRQDSSSLLRSRVRNQAL